jgi:hypothetical protein
MPPLAEPFPIGTVNPPQSLLTLPLRFEGIPLIGSALPGAAPPLVIEPPVPPLDVEPLVPPLPLDVVPLLPPRPLVPPLPPDVVPLLPPLPLVEPPVPPLPAVPPEVPPEPESSAPPFALRRSGLRTSFLSP